MNQTVEQITQQYGLAYFGRMGASISHDIKNCLAIINENAGLMSDLLMMAQKGVPPELDRFSNIVQRIEKQIGRADGIVKSMNMFSHSMDRPDQQIDIDEAVGLTVTLGARICANAGLDIVHIPSAEKRYVKGSFFFILFLIWTILENATENLASGGVLNISSKEDDNKQVSVAFECDHPFSQNLGTRMDEQDMVQVLELFKAQFIVDEQNGSATLVFKK